jgi:hypothetical protein
MNRWYTPREAIQIRGYCTGPVDGGPAPGDVGLDYRAACCTCGRRVAITSRGLYAHHRASVESQRKAAEALLPKLTRTQIRALRRYAKRGSWYRVHHVHGLTISSLEDRRLVTRNGHHVTPLGHAVLAAEKARIPNIFDGVLPRKSKPVKSRQTDCQ